MNSNEESVDEIYKRLLKGAEGRQTPSKKKDLLHRAKCIFNERKNKKREDANKEMLQRMFAEGGTMFGGIRIR